MGGSSERGLFVGAACFVEAPACLWQGWVNQENRNACRCMSRGIVRRMQNMTESQVHELRGDGRTRERDASN